MRETKKIHWKLNLFDIGLIAVVLVATGLFAYTKLSSSPATADPATGAPTQAQSVTYVVQLEQVLPQTAKMVADDQHLYERTKKEEMGVITSFEVTDAKTLTKDEENPSYNFVDVPDRKDVTLVLTSPATFHEDGITLASGLEIRAGNAVRVLGPGYYGSGYILSIERG